MRIVVFRLSSLGDVILSTAFLENLPPGIKVDWVIASEFAFVLKGHPRIENLIIYDKKTKLAGWTALIKKLKAEKYDVWVDLHSTLRTRVARILTLGHSRWIRISKTRWKFIGYVTLKRLWPRIFRPVPFWKRFARMAHRLSEIKTPLLHALNPPSYLPVLQARALNEEDVLTRYQLKRKTYFAIVPASKWASKEWPAEKYAAFCAEISTQNAILVLGRKSDPACQTLIRLLEERDIAYVSALDEADFAVTAILLKNARAYLGGDTGLAHLSEAVGLPSLMIFGPTRPQLGFGPWRPESRALTHPVWCSPCSKDGRICYRLGDRFACLRELPVKQVIDEAEKTRGPVR